MCIHLRIIYSHCGHSAWGLEVSPCNQQTAYLTSPTTAIECDTMYSHPLHTTKIERSCKKCEKKRAKTERTSEKLRQALKEIRERVEKMEGGQTSTAKENSRETDDGTNSEVEEEVLETWE